MGVFGSDRSQPKKSSPFCQSSSQLAHSSVHAANGEPRDPRASKLGRRPCHCVPLGVGLRRPAPGARQSVAPDAGVQGGAVGGEGLFRNASRTRGNYAGEALPILLGLLIRRV